jgi:tetratricopeptide (TPR) repeat protein
LGRNKDAESTITQVETLAGSNALSLSSWATFYRARDEENKAQEVLEQMLVLYNDGNQDSALVPMIGAEYARNDNFEEAMIWYERAYEMPSPFSCMPAIWTHPESAIWNHPGFRALMKKMNLDDASVATAKAAVTTQF